VDVGLKVLEGVTELKLRLQVIPGTPVEQASATALLNPFNDVTVTVEVAEPPATTVDGDAGEAEIWKSGNPGATVKLSAAMCARMPDAPYTAISNYPAARS
jgi:hypothetical protein